MAFYIDLTAVRSDDVQRVIEVVESDLQSAHGLIPLSEWIDRPALAVVYQPHAGWIVVAGGIGSGFLLGIELSRQLKTNVLAVMSANLHAAGFRIFGSGCENARHEISVEGYGGMSDPIEHFDAFRAIAEETVSDESIRDVLGSLDMNDAESIGELLSLLGLPKEFGHGPPEDVENSVAYGLPAIAAFIEGDAESGDEPGGGFGPFGDFGPDLDGDILRGPW